MATQIDHLVIGAATLEQGVDYVRGLLGVEMPVGGEHPRMGTHNRLMQLGPATFLEILAINPLAPTPSRPRWFGLDDPFVQAQLRQQPRLLTWVVNTPDLAQVHQQSQLALGAIERMSRGSLNWLITIPDDGHLLAAGLLPTVIQWQTAAHPAHGMANLGCSLRCLTLYHPQIDWLRAALATLGIVDQIELQSLPANNAPYLVAQIQTPTGYKTLSSQLDA